MNPLVKVTLRYALILVVIQVVLELVHRNLVVDNRGHNTWIALLVIWWIALATTVTLAHVGFKRKNGSISFSQAIGIGYLLISVTVVAGFLMMFISESPVGPPADSFGEPTSTADPISWAFDILFPQILIDSVVLFTVILIEAQWKIYQKAGKPGWASIIPFYNLIVLLEIVRKPLLWFVLLLIPGINIIFGIWVVNILSRRFGQEGAFTAGLIFLPFIFYPILGFGTASYNGGELEPLLA